MSRPRLDAVYAGQGPRDVSGAPRHDARPKKRYCAEYRMNSGHWVEERFFEAHDDEEARRLARAILPKRRKQDQTWMYVSRIWAVD